jgi:protein-disulfide isomerase
MLVGWFVAGGRPAGLGALRWPVRLGAAASLLFVTVMLVERKLCPYCLTAHLVNFAFVVLAEVQHRAHGRRVKTGGSLQALSPRGVRNVRLATIATFASATLALLVADARVGAQRDARAEAARVTSTAQIVAAASQAAPAPKDPWGPGGFTGRYRQGPESSAIRIVMLTDYQCPDCKRLEQEAVAILARRADTSLSIKHFPMCTEAAPGVVCNRAARQNLHPNACWAARAAEAAGILAGDEGFWKMHHWLFARSGTFRDADLSSGLVELGFDPAGFLAVMQGAETLRRVHADVDEGIALGLHYTPMIFINGVEMKGWNVPNALSRTVEEVAAKAPPARTAAADRPPLADQKYVQDWKDQPRRALPADRTQWSTGAAAGGAGVVEIVLFGDYQESNTAAIDRSAREIAGSNPRVRYTFRHYPIDPSCNTALPAKVRPEALHPRACWAAKMAEAAGSLGGPDGYWKTHEWLLGHQGQLTDEALAPAVAAMGLSFDELRTAAEAPGVAAAIVEDALAAKQVGLTGVPMVFVDSRFVPRVSRDGESILPKIVEEALTR